LLWLSGFIIFGINNIWAAFERGCQEKIQEVDELQPYARVELDNQRPNEDLETQSLATNASRFMNYRLTARNQFFTRDQNDRQTQRTLLIPEGAERTNENWFRTTIMSNFTRTAGATVRAEENEAEGDIEGESEGQEIIQNAPEERSNGFSNVPPGQQSVAKYKMIKD
jgi:hypothetical protein